MRIRADGELFRVRYTHDDLGRIAEARETILGTTTTWSYAYDLVGQLIEVRQDGTPDATYTYDENGNRRDIPGVVHNGDDQLLQYGDTSYTYNAAGQLVEKVRGAELTRYDYSVLDELEQVELPDGRAIDYQHDAMQRRIGRQVDGVQTHRWLWGGAAGPVAEVDANGNTLTTFVYATGINVPDFMVRGPETFALIRDHLGSVRFVVNTATNAIAQELRYDPFGKVLLDTNPGFQPFGYAGGLYDPDTGLTRFGARDYDAHTGRWTARDPIAFGGGQTNLYVYVGNDPINFVDLSGSVAIPAVLGAIWGAIEFGLAVYDVYDFATTMMDSCSTTSDRLMSAGGVFAGAILPGGGYGAGSKAALKALPPPRPVWTGQIINYKKGAMSSIEHIFYRHGPEGGFSLVGRFAEGTRGRDVVRMVEEAARGGKWDCSNGRASILYDFQRTIGTQVDGSSATRLQVYLNQAGEVMTAFPVK